MWFRILIDKFPPGRLEPEPSYDGFHFKGIWQIITPCLLWSVFHSGAKFKGRFVRFSYLKRVKIFSLFITLETLMLPFSV